MEVSALYEVAEVELIYKSKVKASNRPKITTAKDAYEVLIKAWDENKIEFVEQFKVLFLNRSNKVLGIYEVSSGGISGTVADPRVIFAAALKANCSSIMLSHNHPSGNPEPSREDIVVTKQLVEAGKLMGIPVHDHLILAGRGYTSLAERGLM